MSEQIQQPVKTPIAELAQKTREHYAELTKYPNDFNSIIPEAIDLWERHELERERTDGEISALEHFLN